MVDLIALIDASLNNRLAPSAAQYLRDLMKAQLVGKYLGLLISGGRVPKGNPLFGREPELQALINDKSPEFAKTRLGSMIQNMRIEVEKEFEGQLKRGLEDFQAR